MGRQLITGVIEGFYGPPWTGAERLRAFETMAGLGLDTYVYAPKDDLSLRARWREPYGATQADALRQLIAASLRQDVQFVWGVSPGLDIRYADDADLERLHGRFEQLMALGCRRFALLFDDVPDRLEARDLARWGSLAAAQAHAVNECHSWLRRQDSAARLAMCPTAYCERMSRAGLGGPGYLEALGRLLDPAIDVFWTGPDIISREISPAHAREVRAILQRKPLIWDNLHANDYDGRRMFCGPYAGRDTALLDEVAGILSNPNCEWPLNAVPLHTLAGFVRAPEWDARAAYLDGVRAWSPAFETVHGPAAFDDLVLFLDCYYLPHEEGDQARALYDRIKAVMRAEGSIARQDVVECQVTIDRLRDFCARLSDLCDRPLFHALWRRSWELREELDLLARYVAEASSRPVAAVRSDFHLPSTYRGGMVPRLQRLLTQRPDGAFVPAATAADRTADHDADHAT